jgi:hypothetical protein
MKIYKINKLQNLNIFKIIKHKNIMMKILIQYQIEV